MMRNIFSFFGMGASGAVVRSSKALFDNCTIQASLPAWYSNEINKGGGLIYNDFRSKHTMLILHVWMIHKRLIIGDTGRVGKNVQECLFDELWEDTSSRIRNIGIAELSVNKNLKDVQGYSFKCMLELDHALTRPSEDEIVDTIGGTLWRFVYMRRNEVDVDHVLELANYIRREQKSVLTIPTSAIFDGRLDWGPLPNWSGNCVPSAKEEINLYLKKSNPPEVNNDWQEAIAPDGKIYFWNTKTRERSWKKPK